MPMIDDVLAVCGPVKAPVRVHPKRYFPNRLILVCHRSGR
jgi:hypothetical protein